MKKLFLVLLLIVATLGAAYAAEWSTNLKQVEKESKMQSTPILMLFTGSDWCPACKYLDTKVLQDKQFDVATKDVVTLLYLDFPHKKAQTAELKAQNLMLSQKYKITGYPTLLLVNAVGTVLTKQVGAFGDFSDFKAWLANGLKIAGK